MSFELTEGEFKSKIDDLCSGDLHPVDDHQTTLTEELILPFRDELENFFAAMRVENDADIKKFIEEARSLGRPLGMLQKYPIGLCKEIRNAIFEAFQKHLQVRTDPVFRNLQEFQKQGGVIKKIYGTQHGKYFQNAIQMGSYFFDVANDTVDAEKPSVVSMPLSESGFENIEDLEKYADVATSYWHEDVYPNRHFDNILPISPMLFAREDGSVYIPNGCEFVGTNLRSGGEKGVNFIINSTYSDKTLPEEACDRLAAEYEQKPIVDKEAQKINCDSFTKIPLSNEEIQKRLEKFQGLIHAASSGGLHYAASVAHFVAGHNDES